MMRPSLFGLRERGKVERIYEEGGWGPELTWRVPRHEAEPLVFQLRVPIGLELVDVETLAAAATGAPPSLGEGVAALRRAREAAGAFLVGALRNVPKDGDGQEVLATLTVALAEIEGPPDPGQFKIADSETTVRSEVDVTQLSDKVTRIHRLSLEAVDSGGEPIPMVTEQYLIETRYGALIMAFSTSRMDMMGGWALKIYEGITQSAYIGNRPAPY